LRKKKGPGTKGFSRGRTVGPRKKSQINELKWFARGGKKKKEKASWVRKKS